MFVYVQFAKDLTIILHFLVLKLHQTFEGTQYNMQFIQNSNSRRAYYCSVTHFNPEYTNVFVKL